MPGTPEPVPEPAHDILAAEEFGMPAGDPSLHREPAHDVLAAEEFGMPAPDPALHHAPVVLPEDPSGIAEPHDILAAEEFAMPAARSRSAGVLSRPAGHSVRLASAALAGAFVALLLMRLFRRR